MRTLHIPSVISVSTLFCLVATTAAAEGRIMNLRPILPPAASSSSSSSDYSAESSASSVSSVKQPKAKLTASQQSRLKNYCKDIAKLLNRAASIAPTADQQSQFNLSVDMLTKADALCASMLAQ